jgi:hypothetical protein
LLPPSRDVLGSTRRGAFNFNQNPLDFSYATRTAADALGLPQAFGAILSSPGAQHPSMDKMMRKLPIDTRA